MFREAGVRVESHLRTVIQPYEEMDPWWTTAPDRLGGKRPCDDTPGAARLLFSIAFGLPA